MTIPRHGFQKCLALRCGGLALALMSCNVLAEPPSAGMSDAQIARQTSDPTSNLWYFFTEAALATESDRPFRNANAMTLEFQPSLPVLMGNSWRILNFPDLVLASQGTPEGWQVTGLQSLSYMPALSPPSRSYGFAWGVGPYMVFPVSTDPLLGPALWQVGPGGVFVWRSPNFVSSLLIQPGWSVGGSGSEAGSLRLQYNIQYFFGDGYQVGLGRPRVEYNWRKNGGGGWDVPFGLDVAKVFHVGKIPVKIILEYDFYAINDSRWQPEHLFRITFIPVLRSPFGEAASKD